MIFKLVNLTLPMEQSNDPRLLIDIGVMLGDARLPIRARIFDDLISLAIGEKVWTFDLCRPESVE